MMCSEAAGESLARNWSSTWRDPQPLQLDFSESRTFTHTKIVTVF